MTDAKRCSGCGETKAASAFYFRNKKRGTLRADCKACVVARSNRSHALNPQRSKRSLARFHAKHPRYQKNYDLQRNYGIDLAAFDRMRDAQNYACAICERPEAALPRRTLVVDHDHDSGHVRGLLCATCNTGIGHFADDPARMRNAIHYMEKHSGKA